MASRRRCKNALNSSPELPSKNFNILENNSAYNADKVSPEWWRNCTDRSIQKPMNNEEVNILHSDVSDTKAEVSDKHWYKNLTQNASIPFKNKALEKRKAETFNTSGSENDTVPTATKRLRIQRKTKKIDNRFLQDISDPKVWKEKSSPSLRKNLPATEIIDEDDHGSENNSSINEKNAVVINTKVNLFSRNLRSTKYSFNKAFDQQTPPKSEELSPTSEKNLPETNSNKYSLTEEQKDNDQFANERNESINVKKKLFQRKLYSGKHRFSEAFPGDVTTQNKEDITDNIENLDKIVEDTTTITEVRKNLFKKHKKGRTFSEVFNEMEACEKINPQTDNHIEKHEISVKNVNNASAVHEKSKEELLKSTKHETSNLFVSKKSLNNYELRGQKQIFQTTTEKEQFSEPLHVEVVDQAQNMHTKRREEKNKSQKTKSDLKINLENLDKIVEDTTTITGLRKGLFKKNKKVRKFSEVFNEIEASEKITPKTDNRVEKHETDADLSQRFSTIPSINLSEDKDAKKALFRPRTRSPINNKFSQNSMQAIDESPATVTSKEKPKPTSDIKAGSTNLHRKYANKTISPQDSVNICWTDSSLISSTQAYIRQSVHSENEIENKNTSDKNLSENTSRTKRKNKNNMQEQGQNSELIVASEENKINEQISSQKSSKDDKQNSKVKINLLVEEFGSSDNGSSISKDKSKHLSEKVKINAELRTDMNFEKNSSIPDKLAINHDNRQATSKNSLQLQETDSSDEELDTRQQKSKNTSRISSKIKELNKEIQLEETETIQKESETIKNISTKSSINKEFSALSKQDDESRTTHKSVDNRYELPNIITNEETELENNMETKRRGKITKKITKKSRITDATVQETKQTNLNNVELENNEITYKEKRKKHKSISQSAPIFNINKKSVVTYEENTKEDNEIHSELPEDILDMELRQQKSKKTSRISSKIKELNKEIQLEQTETIQNESETIKNISTKSSINKEFSALSKQDDESKTTHKSVDNRYELPNIITNEETELESNKETKRRGKITKKITKKSSIIDATVQETKQTDLNNVELENNEITYKEKRKKHKSISQSAPILNINKKSVVTYEENTKEDNEIHSELPEDILDMELRQQKSKKTSRISSKIKELNKEIQLEQTETIQNESETIKNISTKSSISKEFSALSKQDDESRTTHKSVDNRYELPNIITNEETELESNKETKRRGKITKKITKISSINEATVQETKQTDLNNVELENNEITCKEKRKKHKSISQSALTLNINKKSVVTYEQNTKEDNEIQSELPEDILDMELSTHVDVRKSSLTLNTSNLRKQLSSKAKTVLTVNNSNVFDDNKFPSSANKSSNCEIIQNELHTNDLREDSLEYEPSITLKKPVTNKGISAFLKTITKQKNQNPISLLKEFLEKKPTIVTVKKTRLQMKPLTDFFPTINKINKNDPFSTFNKNVEPMKKTNKITKPVPSAQMIDGKIYRPKKLYKAKRWMTPILYRYLQKKMAKKYGIKTTVESENLMKDIGESVDIIMKSSKHQPRAITNLAKNLTRCEIITTMYEFYDFCDTYLPSLFCDKVVPRAQAFKKDPTVPFQPALLFKDIAY